MVTGHLGQSFALNQFQRAGFGSEHSAALVVFSAAQNGV
jgi:hypothetical protein